MSAYSLKTNLCPYGMRRLATVYWLIMTKAATSYDRIYEIVRQIPRGYVATYGQIAELANLARKARVVGYALYRVDMQALDVPWQRVVNAKGEISLSPLRYGTDYLQRSLLEAEGIIFSPIGKIDLRKYLWKPDLGRAVTSTDHHNIK